MNENQQRWIAIMMILGIGIFALWSAGTLLSGTVQPVGWEVRTQLWSVNQNGVEYTSTSLPEHTDYWGASGAHYDTDEYVAGFYGEELPSDDSGPPDIVISIGGAKHMSFGGYGWTVDYSDTPYDTITKYFDTDSDGENDYAAIYKHHVYMFEVDVSTMADIYHAGISSRVEAYGSYSSIAKVLTRSLFEVNKWNLQSQSFEGDDDVMYLPTQEGWAGVMSASVMSNTPYFVQAEISSSFIIDGFKQEGGLLNMWTEEGSRFWPETGDISQISGIPSAVIIDHYVELQGGYVWPLGGSIAPRDVGLKTEVRVDVLTSQSFVPEAGDLPTQVTRTGIHEGSDPLGDFFTWLLSPITALFDWMGQNWMTLLAGIAVIIVVIVVIIYIVMAARVKMAQAAFGRSNVVRIRYAPLGVG